MALSVTELKCGTVFKETGEPFLVLKYSHTKRGRGLATIRVKVKNLKTGAVSEKTFNSGMRLEEAEVTRKSAQFLYPVFSEESKGEKLIFMDPETFEQFEIPRNIAQDAFAFLLPGTGIPLIFFEGELIDLELPVHVELKVIYAEKGAKGDSVTNVLKPVTVETGLEVQAPLFIETGDVIKVDTRTGEYVARVV